MKKNFCIRTAQGILPVEIVVVNSTILKFLKKNADLIGVFFITIPKKNNKNVEFLLLYRKKVLLLQSFYHYTCKNSTNL